LDPDHADSAGSLIVTWFDDVQIKTPSILAPVEW